jgi:hypothetical protein
MLDLPALFQDERFDDDYLKFDRVANPKSKRPDLHAFLLLDSLVPGIFDMVARAEHDEIYLKVYPDDLAEVATEEQILELIRCGVRYDSDTDGLAMFV